jgi:hypothetical protein
MSKAEAVAQYRKTGKHLGKFSSVDDANAYAKQLHEDQDAEYSPRTWGDKPVGEPEAKPKGFFASLTEGGARGIASESLPVQIGERWRDMRMAEGKFQAANEWDNERKRRQAAGESLNGMEQWKLKRINDIIAESKPPEPPHTFGELWDGIKKAAVDDPAGFAGKMVRGLIADPELLLTPEALPERMAAIAGKAGKVATEAAQIGAAAGAESVLHQEVKSGRVSGQQTALDAGMTAAPLALGRAIFSPKVKAQVSMAVDLALTKDAAAKGIEPSNELVRAAVADTEARVGKGQPIDAALKDALESVKLSPEAAADAAELVAPPKEVADAKGNEGRQVLPEAKEQAGQVVGGGDLPVVDRPKPEVGQAPQKAQVIRPQQFKPLPEGVPKRFVTAEESRVIYELAGMDAEAAASIGDKPIAMGALRQRLTKFMGGQAFADNVLVEAVANGKLKPESGQIDPVLLKVLGVSGLGGAAAALYTQDPKDAVLGALAVGGVIAAGALLGRGVRGVGEVLGAWDRRYRVTKLTDDYSAAVQSAKLANSRFASQLKTLVSDQKGREALTFYLQGDERARLTPEQEQAAKAVQEYFRTTGEKAQGAGVIEALRDQYVTQLWTGLNKNMSVWRNLVQSLGKSNTFSAGMSPRSRFNMERVIPSYKEGMAKGLVPSTLDIAEIVRIYGDNVATAIANKNFIAALKRDRMPTGQMILASADTLTKDIAEVAKRTKEQWPGGDKLTKDIQRFAEGKVRDDYVLMNHPQMMGMWAHKDVAPVLKWFFDANSPNAATKLALATSIAAKRGLFSFSFFHNASLLQAMLGQSAKAWVNVLNGDAWRLLKGGQRGDILDDLVKGGLQIAERPLEGDATPFTNALKLIGEKYPIVGAPVKGINMVQEAMNGFLWGVVQPTFKVATAMAAMEKTLKRSPEMTRAEAARTSASFTNDMFGGLDWFKIANGVQNRLGRDLALAVTSPAGRRWMQITMLAPDWTVATARTLAKAVPGISSREIAALHQGYVVRSALLYATIGDGLNTYFSGHHFWENDDPTMIDLGDGRKLQMSKHFMEPIHWLMKPDQQALNKLGYVIKEPFTQATNKQYLSTKGAPPIVPAGASVGQAIAKRGEHALGSMMPITGQQAFENGMTPALSGFFGFPIYGKTEDQQAEAARTKATEAGKDADAAAERARKRAQRVKAKADEKRAFQ